MATDDVRWMKSALREAAKGWGTTNPNPLVGAVIVKNGKLLGKGYHIKAGGPHAEVNAIAACGRKSLKGATIYVTLEPCCTFGRTPPCTEAIIKSGISRVVFGCTDPNPKHAGKAVEILRGHGRLALLDAVAVLQAANGLGATQVLVEEPFLSCQHHAEAGQRYLVWHYSRHLCKHLAVSDDQTG